MSLKLAVLSDIHYSREANSDIPSRRNDLGADLLSRAVVFINRELQADLTFIAGDLLNDPDSDDASELLGDLKGILASLDSETIVIPGNHDPHPETFYSVMKCPPEYLDINGIRFIPFIDKEEPGYNASRSLTDLKKMRRLSGDFSGPCVYLQHVPVFPPDMDLCPYAYTNAEELIDSMSSNVLNFSISGHFHSGFGLERSNGNLFVAAPALCEAPFSFLLLEIEEDSTVHYERHSLNIK